MGAVARKAAADAEVEATGLPAHRHEEMMKTQILERSKRVRMCAHVQLCASRAVQAIFVSECFLEVRYGEVRRESWVFVHSCSSCCFSGVVCCCILANENRVCHV